MDWRDHDSVVTPIKDQGLCGSCWAFTATEVLESHLALATGKQMILSAQNVTSCANTPDHCGGLGGCNGGTPEVGFGFAQKYGITMESLWPYAENTGICMSHGSPVVKASGCVRTLSNSYNATMRAVASGPVAINVDAASWVSYHSGVFDMCEDQAQYEVNHAVQLVGYGVKLGAPYWIVRNHWGAGWGESGYMRIRRSPDDGSGAKCKLDTSPQSGVGCDGGPTEVTVCGECGVWFDVSYPTGVHLV